MKILRHDQLGRNIFKSSKSFSFSFHFARCLFLSRRRWRFGFVIGFQTGCLCPMPTGRSKASSDESMRSACKFAQNCHALLVPPLLVAHSSSNQGKETSINCVNSSSFFPASLSSVAFFSFNCCHFFPSTLRRTPDA